MKRLVSSIENGTVIDHIKAGMANKVAILLDLFSIQDTIIIGMNLESKKMGRKDIIKVKNSFLTKEHIDKIALISPNATINIIKDHNVIDKFKVEIPRYFENIIKCRNPSCISRKEDISSKFRTYSKDPLKVKCEYCERVYVHFEIL